MANKSSTASDSPLTQHSEQVPYKSIDRSHPSGAPQPHAEHGAPIDHKIPQEDVVQAHPNLLWSRIRHHLREPFSEFWGTFILVLFGDGAIAQVTLSSNTKGDWQSICWGFGIGIMVGVYVSGISGGNINPAVTLTNAILRRHPWRKVPTYWLAQLLGAMTAAAALWGNYRSAIDAYEGDMSTLTVPLTGSNHSTAGIFATYPADFMTTTGCFFSEFLGTFILMFSIYALTDTGNIGLPPQFVPLGLFFVLFGIAATLGYETGFALNPARDFGPRMLTSMVGYGREVWTVGSGYAWVPVVAPMLGAVAGGWCYDVFLFTGVSPVNEEGMGLKRLMRPKRDVWSNTQQERRSERV